MLLGAYPGHGEALDEDGGAGVALQVLPQVARLPAATTRHGRGCVWRDVSQDTEPAEARPLIPSPECNERLRGASSGTSCSAVMNADTGSLP